MAKRSTEEVWDGYSVTAAKSILLYEAARMMKAAGTNKAPIGAVVDLNAMVTKVLARVTGTDTTSNQAPPPWSEGGVTRFFLQCFAMSTAEAIAAIDRVKFEARKLRGQLDLFDKGVDMAIYEGVDAFVREQLTDAAGKISFTSVRNEIADYFVIMHEVRKVYMHVTGGRVSLPNTTAEQVNVLADDYMNDCVEEAIKRMSVADLQARIAEIEATKKAEPPCDE